MILQENVARKFENILRYFCFKENSFYSYTEKSHADKSKTNSVINSCLVISFTLISVVSFPSFFITPRQLLPN